MKFHFYSEIMGGHTHVRLFAGKSPTLGLCGELVFRNEEWTEFLKLLDMTADNLRLFSYEEAK